MSSCEKSFEYCQLWHLSKGWIFFYLPWKFWHETISILVTCAPNFKVRRFTQKNLCKFIQHVALGEWFFTSMWNFTLKMTLLQGLNFFSSQQHMLVDFEYLFSNEYFGLEIWHTCYQHRDGLMPKISWQKNNFSTFRKVSKLAVMKFFLTTTHVGRFLLSFFE